jgi:hypothetical protein
MAQGSDTSDDGFFSRWSQRKQLAQRTEADLPEPPAPESVEDAAPQAPDLAAPQITPEELAALPAIEDLTPQSDIRAFMRAGVPKGLRNAALRKMWLITPAIRDHIDPAVDYAWDWNTPGGVPGDGLAPSAEQSAKMLRDLFKPREQAEPPELDADADNAELAQGEPAPQDSAPPPESAPQSPPVSGPDTAAPSRTIAADPRPRRHGGALPS